MFSLSKIVTLLLSLILIISTSAGDVKLLEVRNTDNGDRFNLVLEVDQQKQAKGLKLYDLQKRFWKEYNLTDLTNGVALRIESGHEVLILKSKDFENNRGGHFQLNYLVSALTGSRRNLPLKFDFDGTNWQVFYRGSPIDRLEFIVKKFFGRTIGISTVNAL